MSQEDEAQATWGTSPRDIHAFLDIQPKYEELGREVQYILKKRLDEANIIYSAVIHRTKTLASFIQKVNQKIYSDPLTEVTDLAGVRVVYLYKRDCNDIERVVKSEFDVLERIDKVEELGADRFGYGAFHYVVRIGKSSSGARYDDLRDLRCEIQVRTVLQDAWAIIDHHLSYKQETDVPHPLKRTLNQLSGFFENADDQFDRLRLEQEEYQEVVKKNQRNKQTFLDHDIDLDTLLAYIRFRFPNVLVARDSHQLSLVLSHIAEVPSLEYRQLRDIDRALSNTEEKRKTLGEHYPSVSALDEIVRAMALENPEYRSIAFPTKSVKFSRTFDELVE